MPRRVAGPGPAAGGQVVKRGGPLRRRTPLASGDGPKRTAMKRSRVPVNARSAKRAAIADERRAFVDRILRERPTCEGMFYLRAIVNTLGPGDQPVVVDAMRACRFRSKEVHEKCKRSRGGSIIEDDNVLALCRPCHAFTEEQPRLATLAGMLTPSWRRGLTGV